jgi:F420-0:gamma-glutamyl ligase-like protein
VLCIEAAIVAYQTDKTYVILELSYTSSARRILITSTGNIFTVWTGSTVLPFTAAGAPFAEVGHTNFAFELTCLTTDKVRKELVTVHKSHEVLKILSSLHVDIFRN